jgi:hypothetical protein
MFRSLPQTYQRTQRYFEIYSVLLPVCTVATAVKVTCWYCGRVFGRNSNPRSQSFANYISSNRALFLFEVTVHCDANKKKNQIPGEEQIFWLYIYKENVKNVAV